MSDLPPGFVIRGQQAPPVSMAASGLPDGFVIRGSQGSAIDSPNGFAMNGVAISKPNDSVLGTQLSNRWQQAQQDTGNYPAMAPVIGLGVAAGAANDVAGAAVNAVTPDIVKRGLASGVQSAGNAVDSTSIGQSLGDALLAGKEGFNSFMKNNPKTAIALNTAGNVASFIPTERAVEAGISAAPSIVYGANKVIAPIEAASQKLPGILGDVSSGSQTPAPITGDMVKQAAGNAYKAVTDSGTTFSPAVTDRALNIVESAKQPALFNNKVLTKEAGDINAALDEFLPARGEAMKISDLQGLDSNLGDKAAQAYVAGNSNKARVISQVQDNIRELVQPKNIAEGDVIGGSPEGADILINHAVPMWSAQAKMNDIEKIIHRANAMDNPSTAMKTGFRNLMLNSGKMAQFPPKVQTLITKAATTGKVDDLLGIVGSRLNAIAGLHMGPQGAIVSNVTSAAGRGLRTALKNQQADAVLQSMVENIRPSIEKFSNYTAQSVPGVLGEAANPPDLKEIMKMRPAQARMALEKYAKQAPWQGK